MKFLGGLLVGIGLNLPALDLPGIPGPRPLGPETARLSWGNDAFGPASGAQSDDFRTNSLSFTWDAGSWFAGIDHSMLTLANPSGAPVYWGTPDPLQFYRAGARRMDEVTLSAGWRGRGTAGPASGWIQVGPGVRITGDLGGSDLQNSTHGLIGSSPKGMVYEHAEPTAEALLHVGVGGRWQLGGPVALVADGLGVVTGPGWRQGIADLLLTVTAPGGGCWAGVQTEVAAGPAISTTAARVGEHEHGTSLVVGWCLRIDPVGITIETARNLQNDGQTGRISLSWRPEPGLPRASEGERPWLGRFGLCTGESRVPGHGIDTAVAFPIGVGPWYGMIGLRDQWIQVPYSLDLDARRRLLWAGVGLMPDLARWDWFHLSLPVEAGVGWSHARLVAHGFVSTDGGREVDSDALVARAAAGLGFGARLSPGTDLSLVALIDGSVASKQQSVEVDSHDPLSGITRRQQQLPVQGSAIGTIIAATAAWRW